MTMFHLRHPAQKHFISWDEMGCLCRALGFPATMIQTHMQAAGEDIPYDDEGISLKNVHRMLEMNLLDKALHRTFNMHTADWNGCVISKAICVLSHKVLCFEELHNVRVAYMTYEHIDMKGMLLDKPVLLRTLKMCGRTIAPLKLMHRIKHMKGELEEKGRIQLYEFFDLILWCGVYLSYEVVGNETSSGKEEDLFTLVDFNRLLSHHDQRVVKCLNELYLEEEWDFGIERLGPKDMFREPVVIAEARIAQTQYHKKNYQGLKNEVNHAQKRVYRAQAGSIRSRPISSPNIDKYRRMASARRHVGSTAQEAYETVQKRLHSAPSRTSTTASYEKPMLSEFVRTQTPSIVTPLDMWEVQLKMENLIFDVNTLGIRRQLEVEREMDFYIPGYSEKLANLRPEEQPLPEPERKRIHWTNKITNNLAYPSSNLKPVHAKNCDARFRGWQKVNKHKGHHVVLTSQSHETSVKGHLFAKMEQTAMAPVHYLHPDYIIRCNPKGDVTVPSSIKSKRGKYKEVTICDKTKNEAGVDGKPAAGDGENQENSQPRLENIDFLHSKYLKDEESILKCQEGMKTKAEDGEHKTTILDLTDAKCVQEKRARLFPRGLFTSRNDESNSKMPLAAVVVCDVDTEQTFAGKQDARPIPQAPVDMLLGPVEAFLAMVRR